MGSLLNMPSIARETLADVVIDKIKQQILANHLASGDKIPTEKEFADALGISRTSVRDALKTLEGKGIIKTIRGKGRIVNGFDYGSVLENLSYNLQVNLDDFSEVVRIRAVLEDSYIYSAMTKLSNEDFIELEKILNEMEHLVKSNADESEIAKVHAQFHIRIYKVLNNRLLCKLIEMFSVFQIYFQSHGKAQTSDLDEFIASHREFLDAIKAKDDRKVRRCLMLHFDDFNNMQKSNNV